MKIEKNGTLESYKQKEKSQKPKLHVYCSFKRWQTPWSGLLTFTHTAPEIERYSIAQFSVIEQEWTAIDFNPTSILSEMAQLKLSDMTVWKTAQIWLVKGWWTEKSKFPWSFEEVIAL